MRLRGIHFGQTRHFVVHRLDGTSSDFSYHSCIDGRNERRDRLGSLRRGVEDQIIAFREQSFASSQRLICPLRGVPVTLDSCHVDHTPPAVFDVLVQRWLAAENLDLLDVAITPSGDNQIVAAMTDAGQQTSWRNHHRRHAWLRMLSPRANLSDARRC